MAVDVSVPLLVWRVKAPASPMLVPGAVVVEAGSVPEPRVVVMAAAVKLTVTFTWSTSQELAAGLGPLTLLALTVTPKAEFTILAWVRAVQLQVSAAPPRTS